jgi:hypothetical protein
MYLRRSKAYSLRCFGLLACALAYGACASDSEPDGPDEGAGASGKSNTGGSHDGEGGSDSVAGASPASDSGGVGGEAGASAEPAPSFYALGSVVIGDMDRRTTYLQTIKSLDDGPFDNSKAIEAPGNGVIMARGASVFLGLAEEPTWVRYTADADGKLEETGRLSFLDYGLMGVDYGNTIVDDELAVSVLSGPAVAVVWNIKTMEIEREVELSHLVVDGYSLENWTTVAHDGLVYIPGRWADWEGGRIRNGVSTTIIDPVSGEIVGIAEDDRCASGGAVIFDRDGYAYVMGDGRTYSAQMFANAAGKPAPENCLLRIAPGETDFEKDFFYTIPSLTHGLEAIGELETAAQGTGIGFAKMFYPDKLPEGVEPVDFEFWDEPAHKLWRLELADPPTAREVDGMPFSAIGFSSVAAGGKLYSGESLDNGATSDIYETDPETNTGKLKFKMDGYFYGVFGLTK